MAQKTPLPALTVMYADRWNSTWFVDLENFRTQLMEDYHLRFLLTGFLRLKRQWLYLLSIHKSGGFYFFQVITLNSFASSSAKMKPLLEPDNQKKKLLKVNKLVKDMKLIENPAFNILRRGGYHKLKKRISAKKALKWSILKYKSSILQQGYAYFLKREKLLPLAHKHKCRVNNAMRFSRWLKLHKKKMLYTFYHPSLSKIFSFVGFYNKFNIFHKNKKVVLKKPVSLKVKANKSLKLKVNKPQTTQMENTNKYENKNNNKKYPFDPNKKNKKFKKNALKNKRQFTTLAILNKPTNKKNKMVPQKNKVLVKQLYKKKVLLKNFMYRVSNTIIKKNISVYKMLYHLSSYFYRRMFRYKKFPTIREGYNALYKKYGQHLKYTHLLRRLGTSMLFMCKALNRVTAMQNYVYYLPLTWSANNYKAFKKAVVFEKFGHHKYFVSSLALVHLAMSRGSANLIMDLLLRKLRRAYNHITFLSAVEQMCRFFMAPYKSTLPFKHSVCKGIDIRFKGKLNGSERAKTWKFNMGPVSTATFYTNTREQVAKCVTRYGVFNLRVRLKLGSIVYDRTNMHLRNS